MTTCGILLWCTWEVNPAASSPNVIHLWTREFVTVLGPGSTLSTLELPGEQKHQRRCHTAQKKLWRRPMLDHKSISSCVHRGWIFLLQVRLRRRRSGRLIFLLLLQLSRRGTGLRRPNHSVVGASQQLQPLASPLESSPLTLMPSYHRFFRPTCFVAPLLSCY